jgi:hypothetical protein
LRELDARGDPERDEDVAQLRVDRARREEQPRGDLAIGESLGDEASDLQLLGREPRQAARITALCRLAARSKRSSCTISPAGHAELLERRQRGSEPLPRPRAPALPAQVLAEEQLGSSAVERAVALRMQAQRLLEARCCVV